MADNKKISYNIEELEKLDNGCKYRISIKLPMDMGWFDDMNFVVKNDGYRTLHKLQHKENKDGYVYFEGEVFLNTTAVLRYYFSYLLHGQLRYFKKEDKFPNNYIANDEMWKMSVNFDTPEWAKGATMYHIFVDRFKRGSKEEMQKMPRRDIHKSWDEPIIIGPNKEGIWNADFYGGDLLGINESLDYIESLGVNILYLSPVVFSQSNHRYDAADYEMVDPYAGTNEQLKLLCDEAHKRGMKVVLDAVFNHTGNDSKYFNEFKSFESDGAYHNPDSPYSKFYRKHYANGQVYYDYWWGMKNLPVCDGYSKEWQDYILGKGGVIDKWFDLGIDGLRLDVADELTDDFIEKIRFAVHRNKKDGFILGEVWKNPMRMNRGYVSSGKGMDSVMNYFLIDALIRYFKYGDVQKLDYILSDILNEYPDSTIQTLMNFTSTHDISRAINIFSSDDFNKYSEWGWNLINDSHDFCQRFKLTPEQKERGKELYKVYVFALNFLPGILSIFYGDEIGLEGIGNLMNRGTFPWDDMDKELLEYFQYIGSIRKDEEFLRKADLKVLDINQDYFMFERKSEDESSLVVVNRTNTDKEFTVPKEYQESEKVYSLKKSRPGHLTPYGGIALKRK